MNRFLFVAAFGFLPFWMAVAFNIFASATKSSKYTVMTPWLLMAAVPACAVTLAISGVVLLVHSSTSGDANRKWTYSACVFLIALLVLASSALYFSFKRHAREQRIQHEKHLVEGFVMKHPVVLAAAGEPVTASVASWSIASDALPAQYDVSVYGGAQTVHAIVKTDRTFAPTKFTLSCITNLSIGKRDAFKDPCAQ